MYSSIIIADDITIMSLRVDGLQQLLNMVEKYSNKWRFELNPGKSKIVTFGESTQQFNIRSKSREWCLSGSTVDQSLAWGHVGILLTGNFSSSRRSRAAVQKGRSVVGALMAAGAHAGGINPICAAKLWKVFGLPSMLYGCELWFSLCLSDQDIINRATTFAAKRFQGFPMTSHCEGALGSLGLWSTMAWVDKAKLTFFASLCRSSPSLLHKQIFIKRIYAYLGGAAPISMGFVPDIISILQKYELYNYLEDYLNNGVFPSKAVWRNLVTRRIHDREEQSWRQRMLTKPNLVHLSQGHTHLRPLLH